MRLEGSLVLVAEVARDLGNLLERVVFVGGAISPALQEDRPFREPRPTRDVDAIVKTVGYPDFDRIRDEMRQRGFRERPDAPHMHRWVAPGPHKVAFDLVPIGSHLGASGNPWDITAMETATDMEIEPGLTIRHASGPGFLALKFAAFNDRGADDAFMSADLEDIFALVASRPRIVSEVSETSGILRTFVAESISRLLDLDDFDDLVAGHLGSVGRERAAEVIPATVSRFRQIVQICDANQGRS